MILGKLVKYINGKLYIYKKTSTPKIATKLNIETNPDLSGQ